MYYFLRKISIEVVIKANNKTGPKTLIWKSIFDATYFQKWQISFSSSALLKSDKQCKLWAFKMQSLQNPQSNRIKFGLFEDITCPALSSSKIPALPDRPSFPASFPGLFFFFEGKAWSTDEAAGYNPGSVRLLVRLISPHNASTITLNTTQLVKYLTVGTWIKELVRKQQTPSTN